MSKPRLSSYRNVHPPSHWSANNTFGGETGIRASPLPSYSSLSIRKHLTNRSLYLGRSVLSNDRRPSIHFMNCQGPKPSINSMPKHVLMVSCSWNGAVESLRVGFALVVGSRDEKYDQGPRFDCAAAWGSILDSVSCHPKKNGKENPGTVTRKSSK